MRIIFVLTLTCNCIFLSAQEWELKREDAGIKVWTANRSGTGFDYFKAEAEIAASLDQLIRVFKDIPNMYKWYDKVAGNQLLEKISDREGIYTVHLDMPWPVKDRLSVIRAKMTIDSSLQEVEIVTAYDDRIKVNHDGKVWVTDIGSTWTFKVIDENHTFIQHSGHMDPAGSVPAWLAASSVEKGPIKTIKALRKVVKGY